MTEIQTSLTELCLGLLSSVSGEFLQFIGGINWGQDETSNFALAT